MLKRPPAGIASRRAAIVFERVVSPYANSPPLLAMRR
jgi:hypothetical protein